MLLSSPIPRMILLAVSSPGFLSANSRYVLPLTAQRTQSQVVIADVGSSVASGWSSFALCLDGGKVDISEPVGEELVNAVFCPLWFAPVLPGFSGSHSSRLACWLDLAGRCHNAICNPSVDDFCDLGCVGECIANLIKRNAT